MKYIRPILFLSLFVMLYTPLALAQNGAVVTRDTFLWGGIEFNGENVLLLYASDSEGFCLDDGFGDLMWGSSMLVQRPDGTYKYHDKAKFFARVYYPATWADVGDDACDLWYDDTKLIAKGVVNSTYNDNHTNAYSVPHKRRAVWGFNIAGTLEDTAGLCSSGMVDLVTIRRFKLDKDFPDCLPDNCDDYVHLWKGPDISCY